jgi:hypothetical protein
VSASDDVPLIDDLYWLRRGRDAITAVPAQITAAAQSLMTAITWFWTAYTAGALVGVAIAERDLSVGLAVLLAAPAVLLVLAYLAATMCLMPDVRELVPNVPELVRERIELGVRTKRRQLALAASLTVVAALSVSAAIVAVAVA